MSCNSLVGKYFANGFSLTIIVVVLLANKRTLATEVLRRPTASKYLPPANILFFSSFSSILFYSEILSRFILNGRNLLPGNIP